MLALLSASGTAQADPARSAAPPPPAITLPALPAAPLPRPLSRPPFGSEQGEVSAQGLSAPGLPADVPGTAVEPVRITLPFPPGGDALTPEAARLLDRVAARLLDRPADRVELRAFAPPTEQGEGAARRLSLARALAVRSYLLDRGVEQQRLIVYALGSQDGGNAPDRVDLSLAP